MVDRKIGNFASFSNEIRSQNTNYCERVHNGRDDHRRSAYRLILTNAVRLDTTRGTALPTTCRIQQSPSSERVNLFYSLPIRRESAPAPAPAVSTCRPADNTILTIHEHSLSVKNGPRRAGLTAPASTALISDNTLIQCANAVPSI